MQFSDIDARRPALERWIADCLRAERRRVAPQFREYVDRLTEFTLRGGKRFRALAVLSGYYLASGADPAPALPAAAGLELFQSWMLIHDDYIDHSERRRGGPTVHRQFESRHRELCRQGDPVGYAAGMAISLGDLAEPLTVGCLLACPVRPTRLQAALAEYSRMARETAYGQLLDIDNGCRPVDEVSESDVLTVHRLKSAYYTVAGPLRIGACLAGGTPALLAELEAIGVDLGIAFQLRDDVLGAGFSAEETGKSSNDLTEGKRTLLLVRAWAAADVAGRTSLRAVLGEPHASPAQVAAAQDVLRATGSLEYSESKIAALHRRAMRRLGRSRSIPRARRGLLEEIAQRLVHRGR